MPQPAITALPSSGPARPADVSPAVATKARLGLGLLVALVVGSIIGSGIFGLPQNMAVGAGAGAIVIGWAITGVGMLMLALTYQMLAVRQPDLDNGVYAYARALSGEYVGFNAAWGYWVSAWIGNVGYLVAAFGALGYSTRPSARATRGRRSSAPRSWCGRCTSWCCAASRVRRC